MLQGNSEANWFHKRIGQYMASQLLENGGGGEKLSVWAVYPTAACCRVGRLVLASNSLIVEDDLLIAIAASSGRYKQESK